MRISRVLACFITPVILGSGVAASTPDSGQDRHADAPVQAATDAPAFAHEVSDIPVDPRVIYGELANGVRYAVMQNDKPSGGGGLRMRFGTGSLEETDAQQGIAHFLEHMAFNGSRNVPEGEMVKRLERFGLAFGADTNASTGFDRTVYKLNIPDVREEVLDEAFFLMRETADGLLLDADAIERERGVIASEKSARDSLSFRSLIDQMRFFTEGSGLIDRLPIGKDETIVSMPREEFVRFYQSYYHPENTFIVFVGDLDPAIAVAKIEQHFGDWTAQTDLVPPRPVTPADTDESRIGYYHHPELLTFVRMGTIYPYVDVPDTLEKRRQNTLRALGIRMLNRRFMRIIDQGGAPFLSVSAGRNTIQKTMDGMVLIIRSDPAKWDAALAAADLEVRRALQYGFSQAELDEQIAIARKASETAVELANSRKSYPTGAREYNYAEAIVSAFGSERVFNSPQTSLANFETIVADLTIEEVEQAFRERWRGYDDPTIYLSTGEKLEEPEEEIAAALGASRLAAVSPPENAARASFAYTEFGEPGDVVSETYVEDADAYLVRFANNVRLNFKQTDFDADTIAVQVQVGDGFFSMPIKNEGFRRFALNVIGGSGVEGHTADDLQSLFAGKRVSARVLTRTDADSFNIIGTTDSADLASQFNLMTAHVVAPGFREENAKRFREGIGAWYPTHDSSPRGIISKEVPRLIRSGDTRYGFGELETFISPKIEDVRAWVAPQFKTGFIEITVVGDIDKDTVIVEVARTFGALPERADSQPDYAEERALVFPDAPDAPVYLTHAGNVEQAVVRLYWPAKNATDVITYYRLRVLRSILRNRLTDVLREELGSTYSPGVGVQSNPQTPGYGYVFANVTTDPDQVEMVVQATREVGEKIASDGVSADELDRAVQPLIEDLSSSLESNGYWMNVLNDAQSDGFGLERYRKREAIYRNVTVNDLQALADDLFAPNQAFPVIVLPKENAGE
ncbi:M16 family metallopeptidase [Pontixanthobacter sp. CEM42]|uniref:M16 family metallopeptidase n=1 Tax=Pontixanthobacter sp. CEM42 TaxID=2792077 RepID=UPI001ADFDEDC